MERKGLLTKPQEAVIVDALSEWINFKKAIFNVVKKPAIKAAIAAIDDIGLDRIPPDWKTDLIPIVDAAARHDVRRGAPRWALTCYRNAPLSQKWTPS